MGLGTQKTSLAEVVSRGCKGSGRYVSTANVVKGVGSVDVDKAQVFIKRGYGDAP